MKSIKNQSPASMDSRRVGPYLLFIRLARTIGYNLFITNEVILTEVLQIASSNSFARSIFYVLLCKKKKISSLQSAPQSSNRTMT